MRVTRDGAQRASLPPESVSPSPRGYERPIARVLGIGTIRNHLRSAIPRFLALALVAASLATGALASSPPVASAAGIKVVVIVGPVASETAHYIRVARDLASQARSYGARVYEIYSPEATWSRVVRASQGANLLIYLGHGNGFPSPYGPFQPDRMDGFGLNAVAGAGNANQQYFGEAKIERSIRLAPNAVVLLNHLCYASGNAEWGKPDPTLSVAIRRVDNYGAGFLRAGAAAVIADGLTTPGYVLAGLFRSNGTLQDIFWSGSATSSYTVRFTSTRTPGAQAIMDPYRPNGFYRSIIGRLNVTAGQWR